MFFFATLASLVMLVHRTDAGGNRIVPAGMHFSYTGKLPFSVSDPVPLAPAGDGSTSKLFGGFETEKNAFPFFVRLKGKGSCAGVLVHQRYVLTTVTCIRDYEPTTALLGEYDRGVEEETQQEIAVDDVIYHPSFIDIINGTALIKLASRANTRSDAVAVAQLVDTAGFMEKILNNERNCMQLGRGFNLVDGIWTIPRKMQAINVNFVSDDELIRRGYGYLPKRDMIGTEAEYVDECELGGACFGDQGAPVVCKKGGNWVVAALFSYSDQTDGCMTGVKGSENVYKYYDWVQSHIAA